MFVGPRCRHSGVFTLKLSLLCEGSHLRCTYVGVCVVVALLKADLPGDGVIVGDRAGSVLKDFFSHNSVVAGKSR